MISDPGYAAGLQSARLERPEGYAKLGLPPSRLIPTRMSLGSLIRHATLLMRSGGQNDLGGHSSPTLHMRHHAE
jgi:hypothetical protein